MMKKWLNSWSAADDKYCSLKEEDEYMKLGQYITFDLKKHEKLLKYLREKTQIMSMCL